MARSTGRRAVANIWWLWEIAVISDWPVGYRLGHVLAGPYVLVGPGLWFGFG